MKFCREEVSDSDMMYTIYNYDKDGYELVTCTLIRERKFHVGELSHHETPARYLLIFKKER